MYSECHSHQGKRVLKLVTGAVVLTKLVGEESTKRFRVGEFKRGNMRVKWSGQRCRSARSKDYQLQECPGIYACTAQQNKIPVIEIVSIIQNNED